MTRSFGWDSSEGKSNFLFLYLLICPSCLSFWLTESWFSSCYHISLSIVWQQHDVQELCRVMFDALEQKWKKTDQANLINNLYQGKLKDYVKCLEVSEEFHLIQNGNCNSLSYETWDIFISCNKNVQKGFVILYSDWEWNLIKKSFCSVVTRVPDWIPTLTYLW